MTIVKKYKAETVSVLNPADKIYTAYFRSLSGKFRFAPGQFLHLAFDQEYDGIGQWPDSRCFSIQSSPDSEMLQITFSVKGQFTGNLQKVIREGVVVWLKLPYGNLFQQPHSKVNTVFIAGGTGITPFLSLFTSKEFEDYVKPKIYLGFRLVEQNIYKKELQNCCNSSKEIRIFYQNEEGVLDIDYITRVNGIDSFYFISGPPSMIKVFRTFLSGKGISSKKILTDDWE